jgi:very-short-patch-repair endonuclease
LMFGLIVELDGKGNQRVRQQSRQREALLHRRNNKVRRELNTSLLRELAATGSPTTPQE